MKKTEITTRLLFWTEIRDELREAYKALLKGGVSSYKIGREELTRLDLDSIVKRLEEAEEKVDELTALSEGKRLRKSFAVVSMDW